MDSCAHRVADKMLMGSNGSYAATLTLLNLTEGVKPQHVSVCMNTEANIPAAALAAKMVNAKATAACAIYVIGPRDLDIVKIGISADPLKRVADLQVGNWHELVIHALVWADTGAVTVEGLAHKAAVEMGVDLRGEWVSLSAVEAIELVLKAARYGKVGCSDSAAWLSNWTEKLHALAESKGVAKRLAA